MAAAPSFTQMDTDKRFETLFEALRPKATRSRAESWSADDGTRAARISRSGKRLSLIFDDRVTPAFGEFVMDRLQTLYEDYKAKRGS
jgi:ParB family chromosome partitioning protein